MHPLLRYLLLSTVPLTLIGEPLPISETDNFPIEDNTYESEGTSHDIPYTGGSSFTDDIDLDGPEVPSPEFQPPANIAPTHPAEEFSVDLKNPRFSQGVISTEEGGVITGPFMRIQAQKIVYTNRMDQGVHIQTIEAEGDLLMEYAGRAFVGSKLEFDCVKKTGTLYDGKTFVDIWFLGGDRIELKEDGSFYITGAFITTSENQESLWDINAKTMKVTEEKLLSAKNIRFRFLKIPLFWLPSFKSSLKKFSEPPVRYKVIWDKSLGPRATVRYRVLSWEDINLFLRADYRWGRGWGGAVESEYFSKETSTTFVTRSYGAHDKEFPNEKGNNRYRFQGLYHKDSQDERSQLHLTWDKLSDSRMVSDFVSEDFEINTEKRTRFFCSHQFDAALLRANVEPRVNSFDSIDQQLPYVFSVIRPFELGSSGIFSSNTINAGYLNYVFANDLRSEFHRLGLKSSTRSARVETRNTLYRPFGAGPVVFTPQVGLIGIFYGNNPKSQAVWQGIGSYGFNLNTQLHKRYAHSLHLTKPYLQFTGLTPPTSTLNDHFYFDLHDGYHQINQLKIGWKNTLFPLKNIHLFPTLSLDLYTLAFLGNKALDRTFAKSYCTLEWLRPSYHIKGAVAWNHEKNVWDFSNISTDITVSEDIAFGVELRHRSAYDWRKADHTNFILDVARPISELQDSSLSDRRNTFLTRSFFRLAPKWDLKILTKTGWARAHEPAYNSMSFQLDTLLACSWKWRLTYERMPNDNRFSNSFSLIK